MGKPVDFEIAMKELEQVVKELDGEVQLEKALGLFEEGMKLSKQCEDFLRGAEQRIEMLKRDSDGSIRTVPFNEKESVQTAIVSEDTAVNYAVAETTTTSKKGRRAAEPEMDNLNQLSLLPAK